MTLLRFSRRSGYLLCPIARRLSVLSAFSSEAYGLQRAIPSARGSVTTGSRSHLRNGHGILYPFVITFPFRVRLSTRLTLSRLTWLRNPWVFGVDVSTSIIVTYAYIFFSSRSSRPHGPPSTPTAMLPYHAHYYASLASAAVLMPAHHPRNSARLVSCYALFE